MDDRGTGERPPGPGRGSAEALLLARAGPPSTGPDAGSFGRLVKQLRRAQDLTQLELARQVGYSVITIRKVEADGRRASRDLAERLGKRLRVEPEELPAFIALARSPIEPGSLPVGELEAEPGPSRTPTNLAVPLTRLIGRTAETAALGALLAEDDVRLVTLVGSPGIGKSRLGLEVAAQLETSFPDGVFVVPLAAITDPALVAPAIATAVQFSATADRPLVAGLIAHLRPSRVLLLLDNVEHLLAAVPVIAEILTACPRLKVLATSREPLRIRGERRFPVPPLALPAAISALTARQATRYAAIELFEERAQAVDPGFRIGPANVADVAAICANLDGLPLAIELVAVRVNLLAPKRLLGRMDHRLALLTGGPRDLPVRQQTLRNTIDWSYQLLDAAEQTLFARLSVFIGGCSLAAAERVANPDGDLPIAVLDGLATLADKNLLRREERCDGERYFVFFQTIREFAMERLVESGQAAEVGRRYVEYYLELAEELAEDGPDEDVLDGVEAEYVNLRAVLEQQILHGAAEPALRLVVAMWKFWHIRSHTSEGGRWIVLALALSDGRPADLLRAAAVNGGGWVASDLGNNRLALQRFEESVAIYRQLGDVGGVAEALHGVGNLLLAQGRHADAVVRFEESLRLYRQLGHDLGVAWSLDHLGWAAVGLDDLSGVEPVFEESFSLFRRLGDRWGMAMSLHHQGLAQLARGRHAEAKELLQQGLSLFDELSNKWGISATLYHLGQLALVTGDRGRARWCFDRSLSLIQGRGQRQLQARALDGLGCLAVLERDDVRAARLFGAVEATARTTPFQTSPFEQRNRARSEALLRERLDPAVLDREWQAGREMTGTEITDYALIERHGVLG